MKNKPMSTLDLHDKLLAMAGKEVGDPFRLLKVGIAVDDREGVKAMTSRLVAQRTLRDPEAITVEIKANVWPKICHCFQQSEQMGKFKIGEIRDSEPWFQVDFYPDESTGLNSTWRDILLALIK